MDNNLVSVGLAVFNGENYLADAIESILAQTYRDFELVISDNASTDRTREICEAFAARDSRIRYVRQSQNRGAAWNQNEVMRLARGQYFKLAAHDDLIEPRHLAVCVALLEDNPQAILAYTDTYEMPKGDRSYLMRWSHKDTIDTTSASAPERFGSLIYGDRYGYRIFGVIRTSSLMQTRLFGRFHAADHILLAELGVLGTFVFHPDKLFLYRLHPEQSIHLSFKPGDYASWWGAKSRLGLSFPTWRYLREMLHSVFHVRMSGSDRVACLGHIGRWAWTKKLLLVVEIARLKPQTPVWDKPQY